MHSSHDSIKNMDFFILQIAISDNENMETADN